MKGFAKFLVVLLIIVLMVALGGAAAVYYENWEKNMSESDSKLAQFLSQSFGNNEVVLEPNFTCLLMGRNQSLTDFIMLCQYNPNTREASLMSIPRDTYVGNYSYDGKINSVYANKGVDKILEKVTEITGVDVEHYVIFDASILKKVVNAIGGVTVNVPINMNYDDPVQGLYIHINKGVQTLMGNQAEGFVRFRKNNDGTGYPNGDIGRVAAQQSFIKAMIEQMLKPDNIKNVSNIVKIVLDGTKTDITMDVVEEYLDDAITFKMDRLRFGTLPGVGEYTKGPDGLTRSFYIHNPEKAEEVITKLFFMSIEEANKPQQSGESVDLNLSGDKNTQTTKPKDEEKVDDKKDDDNKKEEDGEENKVDEEIKIEVLSAKAKTSRFNTLVSGLNAGGCNVVKIGNYPTTKVESSRIIVYGKNTDEQLKKVQEISGIKKVEQSTEDTTVTFTIVIGANY
ncbi:MAG: LCP family protein [Clostridia bacterium]|nr:LCP family protein [Clostridia bacterium]